MIRFQPVRPGANRSLWWEEALDSEPDAERGQPLAGSQRAEVCIIGGGYTGLWTALRIKELDRTVDVAVLEADLCGSGASGRNGGFTLSWWPKLERLIARYGEEEALRLGHAAEQSISAIGAFCERHGIDAHYRQAGWLWTATTPLHAGNWEHAIRACERRGIDVFQRLTPAAVAARTGSSAHVAGVWERGPATVQPALLARGLRRVALEQGIRVFEHSPVLRLDESPRPVVRSLHGSIAAEKVILAINAWAASLPELRRTMIPVSSDMVATAPRPERLASTGWTGGECITDSRLMVAYYRTTRDGRIAFGRGSGALGGRGRVSRTFDHDPDRAASVAADLRRLYPMLADVPITHTWSGVVDRSETGTPFFGRLGGNPSILYGVGFSGNGVGPTHMAGSILASSALDRRDEWSETPLNRGPESLFPPDPVRYYGGLLVRAAVKRKEETEERGQHAGPFTRAVATLAPSGMRKGGKPLPTETAGTTAD